MKNQKNGFLAKIAWHYLCQEGRKTRIFVHTICFGQNFFWPKKVQSRKNYKNSGFSGNWPKPKMTPFFEKGVFWHGWKVGFTNCVFEKLCFPENTIFIVFSAKHSFSKTRTVCRKKQKFMKNSGLFSNMARWGFLGLFFEVLILKVCFWCVWHCFKSVKNACFFPSLGGFSGVAHCCSSGFGRFRCFCVSCVCFSFCVVFVSVLFALFLVLWLDVVVLFFYFFLFCFFFV